MAALNPKPSSSSSFSHEFVATCTWPLLIGTCGGRCCTPFVICILFHLPVWRWQAIPYRCNTPQPFGDQFLVEKHTGLIWNFQMYSHLRDVESLHVYLELLQLNILLSDASWLQIDGHPMHRDDLHATYILDLPIKVCMGPECVGQDFLP